MTIMINCRNVTVSTEGRQRVILNNVNLRVKKGEFVIIAGKSGSGKTSLLNALNGSISTTKGLECSGSVTIDHHEIDFSNQKVDEYLSAIKWISRNLALIPQEQRFSNNAFSVEKHLMHKHPNKKASHTRANLGNSHIVNEVLHMLEISHLSKRALHTLSGGEKQKVSIAEALLVQPDVLLLDEPTSELDPKSTEQIFNIVKKLNLDHGLTILLVEHRISRVLEFADRLVILSEGQIQHDSTPRHIYKNLTSDQTPVEIPAIVRFYQHLNEIGRVPSHQGLKISVPLNVKESRILMSEFLDDKSSSLAEQKIDTASNSVKTLKKTSTRSSINHHDSKSEELIRLSRISTGYRDHDYIKHLNLRIDTGEFIIILGRNGAGKSTLLNFLSGKIRRRRGKVYVHGKKLKKGKEIGDSVWTATVSQEMNENFQYDEVRVELEKSAQVYQNRKEVQSDVCFKLADLLDKFQLDRFMDRKIEDLSGGEKQKTAICKAFIQNPKLLLLDEPTLGLDYSTKTRFYRMIQYYVSCGNTAILVTHDIESIVNYGERFIFMANGKILVDGQKEDILSNSLLYSPQINRMIQNYNEIPQDILTVDALMDFLFNQ